MFNLNEERNVLLRRLLPNTRFKAMLFNNPLNFRHEVLWETCHFFSFSWDELITYELYLQATLDDRSKIPGFTNRYWKELCDRDYPSMAINRDYRNQYLSRQDVLDKASTLGKQDLIKIIGALFDHQPDDRKWQYSIETLEQKVLEDYSCLNYAVTAVKKNKKLMLAVVKQDGLALRYISEALRNDREIVLAAVRQDGLALRYASEALRNDREIVLAAVRERGLALRYASEAFKKDLPTVLAAVRQDGLALRYASEALKNKLEIVLAAVKQNKCVLQYASERLRNTINLTNDIIDEAERRASCNTF